MPAGTYSKKRMIMDSDEEDLSVPQAGPSTSKRPRHSLSIDDSQVAPPTDKGKGKERAQLSHHSSRPRNPSSSKASAESRAQRRRKAPRTVVTVTASTSTSSGDSPADSVPTLVSSDHEDDRPQGPSTSRTEVDPQPQPQTTVAASDDHDELARLRKEVASKDALIQKQQDAFSALQAALQCQICLEIMWDPYITSCGHTSCLSCLQAWFKAPPADHNPNDAPPLAPHLRRKTCPTCRAPIRTRPTPVFIAKSIISIAKPFLEPSALASESEARPVAIVPGANPGQPADPWLGIFAPIPRPGEGGRHLHHDEDVDGVIEDAEDGVLRCVDCLYEIFEGVCAGCGRIFNDLQDDGGFTDDDGEDEDGHRGFPFFDLGLHGLFRPWHPADDPWHDEDDEVESDEGSDVDDGDNEMHGFIVSDGHEDERDEDEDIDEEDVELHGSQNLWAENHRNWDPIDQAGSESDDDDGPQQGGDRDFERLRIRTARILREAERAGAPDNSEDERRLREEQARERERYMFGNGEYPERDRPQVAGSSRPGARSRLIVQSDDEEDENDGPANEERDVTGDSTYGADGERGWIGDQEFCQSYSDDEEDVEPHYAEDDDEIYPQEDSLYSDGRDWGGHDYSEDNEGDGW